MLRSRFCDYSNAYIDVKRTININTGLNNDMPQNDVSLISDAPFRSCITKINNILIHNAEDLDLAMPVYNLLECGDNCSMMSGSLWNYYRGKTYGVDANSSNGRSFKYKTKVVGKSPETPEGPHYHHKI